MRPAFIIGALLLCIWPVAAQNTLVCDSAEQLFSQLRIQPPEIALDADNEYIVTVIGIGDYDPVVGITLPPFEDAEADESEPLLCNAQDRRAAQYTATLPTTGDVPASDISGQELVLDPGQSFIDVGEFSGAGGEFLVIIEGFFDPEQNPDSDTFTFSITQNLIDASLPLTAYAFGLSEGYTPAMTIDAGGSSLGAQPVDVARLVTDFAETTTAVQATLPRTLTDVSLTIDAAPDSEYALVLHLGSTPALPPTDTAVVTQTPDGLLVLRCGGDEIFQNGIAFQLPATGEYTVTALGEQNYVPVMALVDDTNEGQCFEAEDAARNYSVILPSIQIEPSIEHAQVKVTDAPRTLIIGSRSNFPGDVVLLIEGGDLTTDTPSQIISMDVSPGIIDAESPVRAYAIAAVVELDTLVTLVDATGMPIEDEAGSIIQCDNAGVSATCYGETVVLRDSQLRFGDGNQLVGFELDSTLLVPPDILNRDTTLNIQISGTEAGAIGPYLLAIHLTTD